MQNMEEIGLLLKSIPDPVQQISFMYVQGCCIDGISELTIVILLI